jgi:ankyrin repeat protein
MARFLVETLHVDPNGKGRQGMTPLQFAARSGRMEILQYLLSLSSIDVQITDDRGQTALDAAQVNHHEAAVAALEAHIPQNEQA